MSENTKPTVIALGFFDSVHKGHQKVIEKAFFLAEKLKASVTVFTFMGNLKKAIGNDDEKMVFTAQEREQILALYGVKQVFFAPVNKEFLSLEPNEFLTFLNEKYNVIGYVSGKDYKFGKFGKGDVEYLSNYAKNRAQEIITVDTLTVGDKKISSTLIKELISFGEIEKVNSLLGREYSVTGEVVKDRGVGKTIGYPTANLKIDAERLLPKNGVYYGNVEVDGNTYRSIINLGSRPTFGIDEGRLEANLIDFKGDLYGKTIKVNFEGFIREIQKFSSVDELKKRLEKDKNFLTRGKEK